MNLLLIRFSIVKVVSSQKLKLNVCEVNKAFIIGPQPTNYKICFTTDFHR